MLAWSPSHRWVQGRQMGQQPWGVRRCGQFRGGVWSWELLGLYLPATSTPFLLGVDSARMQVRVLGPDLLTVHLGNSLLSAPVLQDLRLFFLFLLFRATPAAAYGGSQARGRIGATAVGLHHSHSNEGSEPYLQPTHSSRQCRILNPPREARDPTRNLMVPRRIRFCCAMTGTPRTSDLFHRPSPWASEGHGH